MTAFIPMTTRFSVSDCAAAKVAKPAKVGPGPGVPALGGCESSAKVAKVEPALPAQLSQLSQAGTETQARESQDIPGLSQLSQLSRPGNLKLENGAAAASPAEAVGHGAAERAAMVAHYATPAGARPYQPGDPDPLRDGLHAAALCRPTAWADPSLVPPHGAWCSCCGRFERRGGRWWSERQNPTGWCCFTCHPPDHLPPEAIHEVTT